MITTTPAWSYNGDSYDLEQVEQFLPEFQAHHDRLTAGPHGFAYNSDFIGLIPGIAGDDEGMAIYLLQRLVDERTQLSKIAALLDAGFERLDHLTTTTRFARVVLHGTRLRPNDWAEFQDVRLVPSESGRRPRGILPKGASRRGFFVDGREVLVLTAARAKRSAA